MRTFIVVVVLIGLGYWLAIRYAGAKRPSEVVSGEVRTAVSGTVSNVLEAIEPEKIKAEVVRSAETARVKAGEIGHQIAAGTEDARVTATIKAKLTRLDPAYALQISVSTTAGLVTLSGAAKSLADITNIVLQAHGVSGVQNVVSTIQVRP